MTTPTLTDLAALAERVEAATGPSRELDAQIAIKLELAPDGFVLWDVPRFTASIDAALTLLPEGCAVRIQRNNNLVDYFCDIERRSPPPLIIAHSPMCKSLALALTTAALRARSAP